MKPKITLKAALNKAIVNYTLSALCTPVTPLPGRSHFQRTRQQRNDPLCCMTLLAIDWSLLHWACYSALSMGKKIPSWRYAMRPIINMPEEDRATDIGNMHKNS